MAEIFQFNIRLRGFEKLIWREIELTSVSSLAKLSYAVLSAFEAGEKHLFNLQYKNQRYEIPRRYDPTTKSFLDPTRMKLAEVKMEVGDTLTLEYDYGSGWYFDITLTARTEMRRGTGNHYPALTNGQGKGIIEDLFPHQLREMIEQIDKTGEPTWYEHRFSGLSIDWDYREFNLYFCEAPFRYRIDELQMYYEG